MATKSRKKVIEGARAFVQGQIALNDDVNYYMATWLRLCGPIKLAIRLALRHNHARMGLHCEALALALGATKQEAEKAVGECQNRHTRHADYVEAYRLCNKVNTYQVRQGKASRWDGTLKKGDVIYLAGHRIPVPKRIGKVRLALLHTQISMMAHSNSPTHYYHRHDGIVAPH